MGLGIHILAEETVMMTDGTGMDLTADSIVVTRDVAKCFSWKVDPALPEQVRAGVVRTGMDQTVVNLKGIAEGSGGGGMFGWVKKIFG